MNEVEVLEPVTTINVAINKEDLLAVVVYEHERKLEEAKSVVSAELLEDNNRLKAITSDIDKAVTAAAIDKFDANFQQGLEDIQAVGFLDLTGTLSAALGDKDGIECINVCLTLKMQANSYRAESLTAVKTMDIPKAIKDMMTIKDDLVKTIYAKQSKSFELRKAIDNMSRNERAAKAQLAKINLEQTDTGRKALLQLKDATNMPGFKLLEGIANA